MLAVAALPLGFRLIMIPSVKDPLVPAVELPSRGISHIGGKS